MASFTPSNITETVQAAIEEAEPSGLSKLYPYKQDVGELNWAWMATTIGAGAAVGALTVQAKMRGRKAHPAAAVAAVLIGGWVGAKIILPA